MTEEIYPLYSEVEAARMLGIKPRSLRTERYAGRIGYKPVAGKVMYRHADLVAWQQEGVPCQGEGRTKARSSSNGRTKDGESRSGTSDGQKAAVPGSTQQALLIADKLTKSSAAGSSSADKTRKSHAPSAPVIPLRQP